LRERGSCPHCRCLNFQLVCPSLGQNREKRFKLETLIQTL
jgi:hypothetical protein